MNTLANHPALLDKIAKGDQDCMRQLIDQYSGLVWSLVRRKISNAVDAEDLVQEIFAEIWKSAHRYSPSLGSEATFIGVITRRRIIDAIRKKTRHAAPTEIDESIEYEASTETSVTERSTEVESALNIFKSLNPTRRRILELSIVRGLSHSQIVEATDLPLGTVKAHIRRGLEEARALLREFYPDLISEDLSLVKDFEKADAELSGR